MTFGEKVRAARLAAGYSQRDVSEMTGLSLRTIQNYESGERLPKQRESYTLMSRALNVPIQTLLDENADFSLETQDEHVSRAAGEARRLVDEVSVLYAGGDLCEEDMDAMMRAIQDAYWIAKERGRKFQRRVAENRKDVENG
ncbi:MAG: helix-turn-helix transcriptional regulator [Clostridia bacterium]|nr:helix-turn-helix transcriptional regulator [Clostridia bacterium]